MVPWKFVSKIARQIHRESPRFISLMLSLAIVCFPVSTSATDHSNTQDEALGTFQTPTQPVNNRHVYFNGGAAVITADAMSNCNPRFVQQSNSAISNLTRLQGEARKLISSPCQQAIAYQSDQEVSSLQSSRDSVCQKIQTEADKVQAANSGNVNQKTAQDANGNLEALNRQAQTNIADFLQAEAVKIQNLLDQNGAIKLSESCATSTLSVDYNKAIEKQNTELANYKNTLLDFQNAKRLDIANSNSAVVISANNATGMYSAGQSPILPPPTIGPKPPAPAPALQQASKEDDPNKKWLILGAVLGAGLLAILIGKNGGFGGATGTAGGGDCGGFTGNPDQLFQQNGIILVGSNMTSEDKALFAGGINAVPQCLRKYLRGIRLQSDPTLKWSSKPACLPGIQRPGPTLVMNFACQKRSDLVVHELFHAIGNAGNNYSKINTSQCPLSAYAGSYSGSQMAKENFAEAGRFALCGKHGGAASGGCADGVIANMKKLIDGCQF